VRGSLEGLRESSTPTGPKAAGEAGQRGLFYDSGCLLSVLHQELLPVDDFVMAVGATGKRSLLFWGPIKYRLGEQVGIPKFLYMPGSPKPLLGHDVLEQLNVEIKFSRENWRLKIISLALTQTGKSNIVPPEVT